MKAEHRKELQTNELADWLGRTIDALKTNPRSWKVGGSIVLGLVLLLILYAYWGGSSSTTLWAQLASADLKELETLAAEHKNLVGRAARFEMARILYQEGIRDLSDPDVHASAVAKLERARKLYEELANECTDSPMLAQEALMWAARSEEALIGAVHPDQSGASLGSLDRAMAQYKKLTEAKPESFQTKAAAERLKILEERKAEIETFYTRLHESTGKAKP